MQEFSGKALPLPVAVAIVAAGAAIVMELTDQPYGSREFAAEDTEGNVWSFGTYDPFAA